MVSSDPIGSHELKEEVVKAGREEGQDYTDDYEIEREVFETEESSPDEDVGRRRKRIENKKNTTSSEGFSDSNEFGEHGSDYGDDYSGSKGEEYDESNLPRKTFYQSHIYPMHLLENLKVGLTASLESRVYFRPRAGARPRPTSRRRRV